MKRIVAAIDFSDVTSAVIDAAAHMVKTLGGKLLVLHTEAPQPYFIGYEVDPQFIEADIQIRTQTDSRRLEEIRRHLTQAGVEAECSLLKGPTVERILEEAERYEADLIVVGTHEHGKLYHLILGSVREDLICHAPCPVLVVPPKKEARTEPVATIERSEAAGLPTV